MSIEDASPNEAQGTRQATVTQRSRTYDPMAAYAGESHFRLNLGVGPGGAGLDGFAHPGPPHHGQTHDAGPTTAGLDGAYPLQDVAATATPPSAGRRRRRQAADAGSSSTGGQFGILAPTTIPGAGPASAVPLPDAHGQPAGAPTVGLGRDTGERTGGKLSGRIVLDPPNLQAWREKLFAVDETLVLTNEQCVSPLIIIVFPSKLSPGRTPRTM